MCLKRFAKIKTSPRCIIDFEDYPYQIYLFNRNPNPAMWLRSVNATFLPVILVVAPFWVVADTIGKIHTFQWMKYLTPHSPAPESSATSMHCYVHQGRTTWPAQLGFPSINWWSSLLLQLLGFYQAGSVMNPRQFWNFCYSSELCDWWFLKFVNWLFKLIVGVTIHWL